MEESTKGRTKEPINRGKSVPPPLPPAPPSLPGNVIIPPPINSGVVSATPPPIQNERPNFLHLLSMGLLNLNGFGAGYFCLGQKSFGLIEICGLLCLGTAAYLFQNPKNVTLWIVLLVIWIVLNAGGAFFFASRNRSAQTQRLSSTVLVLIGIAALIVEGGMFFGFRFIGNASNKAGQAAYQKQDFSLAAHMYNTAGVMFRLTFSPLLEKAEKNGQVSNLVVDIQNLIKKEKFDLVPDKVDELVKADPQLATLGQDLGMQAARASAAQKAQNGNYAAAVDDYSKALTKYPNAPGYQDARKDYSQLLLDWAEVLRGKGSYTEAIQAYNQIESKVSDMVDTETLIALIGDTYIEWADSLAKQADYDQAIKRLAEFRTKYPNSSSDEEARKRFPELFLQLARQQITAKNFMDAVDNLELVIGQFPETIQATAASKEIIQAYIGKGDYLTGNGQNLEASEAYKKSLALELSASDKDKVTLALGKVLLALGKDQLSQNSYNAALSSFEEAKTYTQDQTLLEEIKVSEELAVKSLAGDSGTQGSEVLNNAVYSACNGQTADSPAVNYFTDQTGKALGCDASDVLPAEITAETPGELRFVVSFSYSTITIETCPYYGVTNGASMTLYRYQDVEDVTIRYAATGDIFKTKHFVGGYPDYCPSTYMFYGSTGSLYGDYVDSDEIDQWLTSVIK